MRYVYLEKDDLAAFVNHLMEGRRLVAPVKKENQFVFADIEDVSQISLEYLPTILPPKKYFFPQKQTLGGFKMGEVSMSETTVDMEPVILFGAHTCDIEGIECLDIVFNENPADPYFRRRRKAVTIVGFECMKPCDEYATCNTMDTHNPKAGYDIMITDIGKRYIIHVNSKEGDELMKSCPLFKTSENEIACKTELLRARDAKQNQFKSALKADYTKLKEVFDASYESKTWKSVGDKCLSCGNCTAVCPTCYCFDIDDDVKLDMSSGERSRTWDSCQLEEFATVTGNENFREERSSRQRHRYFRKFNYSMKKHKKYFCVGCGRCSRACMADISLIDTVNDLI